MGRTTRGFAALCGSMTLALTGVSQEAAPNPVMTAIDYFSPDDEQQQPLQLKIETLDISVKLAAGYAETNTVMSFRNPTDDQLEGQFLLDLPDDAFVTGYGLDVEGRMIPGVIVEGKKAKKAFEARIRRGVDPGLGEVTRENTFKNRVFPINPEETRKVSVTFTSPLSAARPYVFPLKIDQAIKHVTVKVAGVSSDVSLPVGFGETQMTDGGVVARDVALSGALTITPKSAERIGSIQSHPSGEYFASIALPEPEATEAVISETVRIYWDASLSHRDGVDLERKLIEQALQAYAPDRVEIVAFANGTDGDRLYANNVVDAGARLESLTRNGATNLGRLFADELGKTGADVCILVTDARVTLGKFPKTKLPCRLYTLSGAKDADRGALALLAQRGGGRFIDARRGATQTDWTRPGISLTSLRAGGQSILSNAEWTTDGDRLRVLARLGVPANSVSVGVNGETIRLPLKKTEDGTMLGAVWAGHNLSTLRASGATWGERVKLAQEYGVAGEEGSFLVLETIDDYVEQRIALPLKGFSKEERAEYAEYLSQALEEDAEEREDRLADVIDAWEELIEWYRADHSQNPAKSKDDVQGRDVAAMATPAPMAAPPPPPPPSPVADAISGGTQRNNGFPAGVVVAGEEERHESIVVTGVRRESSPTVTVEIREWSPDRPYLTAVKGLCGDDFAIEYLKQRDGYGDLPSFYLEMADAVAKCDDASLAVNIALSALELPAANVDTKTAVANRLMNYGAYDEAVDLYRRVVEEDANRPQPWRDLALALEAAAFEPGTARAKRREILSEALDHLSHVIETPWNGAYDGVELISTIEANRVRDRLQGVGGEGAALDRRLRQSMKFDLRVTAAWNIDEVDMDLWVDEPTGERTYYGNQNSQLGGRLSNDMTNGYGPEEYLIREAAQGKYEVRMNYFRSDVVNPNGAVTLRTHIFRRWGTAQQTMETVDLEFTSDDETEYLVAVVEVGTDAVN